MPQPTTDSRFDELASAYLKQKAPFQRAVRLAKRLLRPGDPGLVPKIKDPIQAALERLGNQQSEVFFVQIGSCDGVSGDPIHASVQRHGWSGIVGRQPALSSLTSVSGIARHIAPGRKG